MNVRYPKLPMAVALGGLGWLLLLYPQYLNVSALVAAGQRSLHALIAGGIVTPTGAFQLDMLGMVIGPLAAALAFLALFSEAVRRRGARIRRAASCVAAALLSISAAAVIWQYSLMNQGLPPAGTSVATRAAGTVLNSVFLCSWALLFGVFAGTTSPFRNRLTRGIASLIAIEAALFLVLLLNSLWGHWRFSRLLEDAIVLSPYALMLIFLLAVRRERATASVVE